MGVPVWGVLDWELEMMGVPDWVRNHGCPGLGVSWIPSKFRLY